MQNSRSLKEAFDSYMIAVFRPFQLWPENRYVPVKFFRHNITRLPCAALLMVGGSVDIHSALKPLKASSSSEWNMIYRDRAEAFTGCGKFFPQYFPDKNNNHSRAMGKRQTKKVKIKLENIFFFKKDFILVLPIKGAVLSFPSRMTT